MFFLRVISLSMLLLSCLGNVSVAQPTKTEMEQLRETLTQLQDKLQSMESPEAQTRSRVKDLGMPTVRPQPAAQPTMILRYYDLSDVFGAAPKYYVRRPSDFGKSDDGAIFPRDQTFQAMGGMGGGGFGGEFSIPSRLESPVVPTEVPSSPIQSMSPAASVTLDSIVDVIDSVIESGEFGSQKRSIEQLGNGLLVNAPAEVQMQISDLFDLFRQQWGSLRMVSVELLWIRAEPNQVSDLLGDAGSKQIQTAYGVGVVADEAWRPFLEQAVAADRIPYSAALSVHNGQTAHVLSGARPIYVSDAAPMALETDLEYAIPVLTYQIRLKQLQLGSIVQLTASTSRGGNFVVLDIHNQINELLPTTATSESSTSQPTAPAAADARASSEFFLKDKKSEAALAEIQLPQPLAPRELADTVDRPDYETYQLSTTVRCPKDRFVLIGGMEGIGGASGGRNMYLFARVSVYDIVLDDAPQPVPQHKGSHP